MCNMQALTSYQQKMKLARLPSPLEYLSYIFAAGNLLSGLLTDWRLRTWMPAADASLSVMPALQCSADICITARVHAGPNFEMADYLHFIERTGPWDPKAERPVPPSVVPGTIRFLKAAGCLVIYLSLVGRFSPLTLEAKAFFEMSLWRRCV